MITKGDGTLGTIYERLRKRSLRKRGDLDDSYASLIGDVAHQHYLKGLLEALQAVQESGQFTCQDCGWNLNRERSTSGQPTGLTCGTASITTQYKGPSGW